MSRTNITTPVGRLVQGSLYKPQTTDAEGKPLVVKSGPNSGQAKVTYYFAIAVPKNAGEQHWAQTPWGAIIYKVGQEGFPGGAANSPTFAWKVIDGDSQIPDRTGKRPCDREGFAGSWILRFSSGFAPKIYNKDGSAAIVEPEAVKLGYFVQVNGDVDANGSLQQPGVFLNHNMVALAAFGPEIYVGPDPSAVGFGTNVALPPGASAVPAAAFTPPVGASPVPVVGMPFVPPVHAAIPPNPAFLQVPGGMPPPPPHVPMPSPPPARVMLPSAGGNTYEQMIAQGWNDALLVQHGHMAA